MLVVAHDAVMSTVRYVCEGLSEREILDLARRPPVRNASVTRLVRDVRTGWSATPSTTIAHLDDTTPP